jgi:energy-coupling factor transporter ATP-binding protein EcfA2
VSGRPSRPAPNPFATRHTQPGSIPPLGADGQPIDLPSLLSRLRANACRGAIVGPHGSGKTNLLLHLAEALAAHGGSLGPLRARSGRDAIGILRSILKAAVGTVVCIDSWEQLGLATRLSVRAAAAWRRCGLLVTSHAPTTLPTLVECHTSPEVLTAIVTSLPDAGGSITHTDIEHAFARHAGNLRDALADLYDRFESRRSP